MHIIQVWEGSAVNCYRYRIYSILSSARVTWYKALRADQWDGVGCILCVTHRLCNRRSWLVTSYPQVMWLIQHIYRQHRPPRLAVLDLSSTPPSHELLMGTFFISKFTPILTKPRDRSTYPKTRRNIKEAMPSQYESSGHPLHNCTTPINRFLNINYALTIIREYFFTNLNIMYVGLLSHTPQRC